MSDIRKEFEQFSDDVSKAEKVILDYLDEDEERDPVNITIEEALRVAMERTGRGHSIVYRAFDQLSYDGKIYVTAEGLVVKR